MIVAYVTDCKTSLVTRRNTMATRGGEHLREQTSEVVNDDEARKCSLAFNIPIRYNNEVR
jgi:hypothetical protein